MQILARSPHYASRMLISALTLIWITALLKWSEGVYAMTLSLFLDKYVKWMVMIRRFFNVNLALWLKALNASVQH